jgi:hypothetical protein
MLRWTRDHFNIMLQEVAESVQRMNAREADKRGEAVRVCKQTIGRACGKTCDSVVYASVGLFRGARLSWCAVLLFVGTVLLHKKLVPIWICLGKPAHQQHQTREELHQPRGLGIQPYIEEHDSPFLR